MLRITYALAGALFAASFSSAQGPYYVNGITGQDLTANGRTPATPWKTLTYAFQQIPPQTPATSDILYVEGNQVYSPATNGETLPVVPAYNIWIEGRFPGGQMPVLRTPAGGTFFRLSPTIVYNRDAVTFRYLVFDGGAYGMQMGAQPGVRHRPRIQDCTFRNQTGAGVQIRDLGNAIQDPRLFQNIFEALPLGIEILAISNGSTPRPDVEECTFRGVTTAAIFLNDQSSGGANVGGSYRSNWFSRCQRGIHVAVGRFAATTNFYIYSSTFADIVREGVLVEIQQAVDPASWVEQCSFLRCGTGVSFSGTVGGGIYTHALVKNTARDCNTGFVTQIGGTGQVQVSSEDNLAENCGTGFQSSFTNPNTQFLVASLRDRALRNRIAGFVVSDAGGSSGSHTVSSAMACGNLEGMQISGSGQVVVRSCTFADNTVVGLRCASATNKTFDHLVFAANGTHVVGPLPITYSCFQGSSYVGTGNLNNTDPLLVRPFYKLASNSPCLDKGNVATSLPTTDYEGDPRASISQQGGQPLPDLGADEYVYAGSVRKYGTRSFGYYNFFPEIGSTSVNAVIGGPASVTLSGAIQPAYARPATGAVLTLGLNDGPGSLPYELAAFGAAGSLLWNDFQATFGPISVSSLGTAAISFTIPPSGSLVGASFTFQWFALLRDANPGGFTTSDGLRMTIGR